MVVSYLVSQCGWGRRRDGPGVGKVGGQVDGDCAAVQCGVFEGHCGIVLCRIGMLLSLMAYMGIVVEVTVEAARSRVGNVRQWQAARQAGNLSEVE